MKSLILSGISALCCLLCIHSNAQLTPPLHQRLPQKAALFSHLPEKFSANAQSIEKLFLDSANKTIKIPLAGGDFFEGTIIEMVQKNANVISINIRSSNYDGALFTLSKVTHNDKSVTYTGRIVSIHYGDIFKLTEENNQFYFTKEKQSLVLVE